MLNQNPTNVSIFEFESVSEYLTAIFHDRKRHRRSYSLRAWALKLGLKSTDSGNLSRVLTGRRDLSKQLGERIVQDLSLSPAERAYFELLSVGRAKLSIESLHMIRRCLKQFSATSTEPVHLTKKSAPTEDSEA